MPLFEKKPTEEENSRREENAHMFMTRPKRRTTTTTKTSEHRLDAASSLQCLVARGLPAPRCVHFVFHVARVPPCRVCNARRPSTDVVFLLLSRLFRTVAAWCALLSDSDLFAAAGVSEVVVTKVRSCAFAVSHHRSHVINVVTTIAFS